MAKSRLEVGDELQPLLIIDRWGDRRIDRFEPDELPQARDKLAEFRTAPGEEACALVYVGTVTDREGAILVEHGAAGKPDPEVLVQRFRPKRGPLRRFRLRGKLEPMAQGASPA